MYDAVEDTFMVAPSCSNNISKKGNTLIKSKMLYFSLSSESA